MTRRRRKARKFSAKALLGAAALMNTIRPDMLADGAARLDDADRKGVGAAGWAAFRAACKAERLTIWRSSGVEGGEYIIRPTPSAKKRAAARVKRR